MPRVPQYEARIEPNGQKLAANAQGLTIDQSLGRSLENLGRTGQQVSSQLQTMQRKQDDDDAQAWIAKTMADTRLQWSKHALESRETAAPGGAGYTPALLKEFDEYAGKTLESAPAQAKLALAQHLDSFKAGLGGDAIQWEAGQRRAYRVDTLSRGIGTAATVVEADPRQYEGALAEQLQSIDGLQMQPDDKLRLADQARKQLSEAAVLGQIARDPTSALRDLEGATPVDKSSPQAAIISAAKDAGIDPRLALAVSSIETGGTFSPTVKNPRSSAQGMFQFLDTTWAQYGGGAARDDVGAQAKAGAAFLRDTSASLTKSLGHKPEAWEIYMGHVFGMGGAPAILKAPDDMPVEVALAKVAPRDAVEMASANGLAGLTVGQVKQKWQSLTTRALNRVAGIDASAAAPEGKTAATTNAAIGALDLNDRLRLRSAAETALNRQQAVSRAKLEQTVQDSTAAYMDGQPVANPPDLDQFVASYGPIEGSRRFGEFRQTQQLGQDISGVKNMSFREQEDLLKRRVPLPGEGYAGDDKRFESLAQAVGETRKQFLADPAQYAVKNSPQVNTAYKALTDAMAQPATSVGGQDALKFLTNQYATAVKAEQQRITGGAPGFTPQLLPDAYVDYVAQQFSAQGQGGQNAANFVMQLADQWGPHWNEAYGQMAKKLPASAVVIGAGMAQAPAALLAEAGKLKREDLLEGLPPTTGNDVRKELTAEFADFGKTLANQVGGANTHGLFYGETEKLALMYVRQGDAPAKAAQRAYADTIGSKYSFQGTYRIPVQQEVGAVTRGADLAMESLDPLTLSVPASTSGLTPEQARDSYASAVRRAGYWVTAPDESGVVLFANGAAVMQKNGVPVQRSWEDLTKLARDTPGFFRRLFGGASTVAPAGGDAMTRATP